MKKKLCLMLALVFILVTVLGSTFVFADEEGGEYYEENENVLEFFNMIDGWEINAVTYQLYSFDVVGICAPNESPDFLYDDAFKFILTNEDGITQIPSEDGIWTLGKGSYTITWTNVEEIKERLKSWELYDEYTIIFPEESELTQHFYIDGNKRKLTFYTSTSSTMYLLSPESQYTFDPVGDPEVYVIGDFNPSALPDFIGSNSKLTYEVKRAGGAVLTEEELKKPLEEGYYMVTWNNMDEIKAMVEASDDEFFDNYELVFPDAPLTKKLTITKNPWWDRPTGNIRMLMNYCNMEGIALPDARELVRITNVNSYDKNLYNEWIQYVEIGYFDESGRRLEESELTDNMPAGTYTAKWLNFYDFQKIDIEKGWGLQEKYFLKDDFDTEYPECEIVLCSNDYNPEAGSIIGNGTLTIVFGCTTAIFLALSIMLGLKLKKKNAEQ